MDVDEQIKLFREFIEQNYYPQLLESVRKGQEFLILDFAELVKFNTEISELLLETPEEIIKAAELSVREFDLPRKVKKFNVRFRNLPESQRINISDVRSKHLTKLIWTEGIVRQKSDVRPHVTAAKFECPSCGNILNVLQLDTKFKEPTRCGCGRKGKFKEIAKELVDGQGLILEESADDLDGAQPKRINVFLKDDLVSPFSERKTSPGTKVKVSGLITEIPITLRSGGQSTKFDLVLESNLIEPVQDDIANMKITEEDLEQIKEIASHENVLSNLARSLAPSIYGHDKIKEALVLQLAGGCRKVRPDGVITRGDMHMLLIGDPGSGKSQLLKRITKIAPKARFTSGKGASLDYAEPILTKEKGIINLIPIGDLIENNCIDKEGVFLPFKNQIETLAFNPKTLKLHWKKIDYGYKHKTTEKLFKIEVESGREITVTGDHSIFFVCDGEVSLKPASKFKKGDIVLVPNSLKHEGKLHAPEIAGLLGYFIAEGHARESKGSYKIEFTLHKDEQHIVNEINQYTKKLFNYEGKVYTHGTGGIRLILYGKKVHSFFKKWLGEIYGKKSTAKRVPSLIFSMNQESQNNFIRTYLAGDAGVTKSKWLMSDLLYLYLNQEIIAGCNTRYNNHFSYIGKRKIPHKGFRFDLKSPHPKKEFKGRYNFIPLEGLNSEIVDKYCQNILSSGYKRFSWNRLSHDNLIERILYVGIQKEVSGPILKKKFGNSVLEYIKENSNIYIKIKRGRTTYTSLTNYGKYLYKKLLKTKLLNDSDFGFCRVKKITRVPSSKPHVYDVSIKGFENFVGGFGGILCHNTGAGLTASVVKDEFLGGWSLEAGTLVLANQGFAVIDEMDKMSKDDRSALHEALEQQTVSIAKANIQATLNCQTTVLAAANPKFGRFDPHDLIANQIDLPPTLINRFDLIFPVKDLPSREKDEKTAAFILSFHKSPEKAISEIPTELLKKFFAYIRKRIEPVITDAAIDEIKEYYVSMRNSGISEEAGIRSIPITARQLEGLVRLAEASAKIRLSKKVTKKDAQKAIELVNYCLNQIARDSETGKIDIDRLGSRITATQRSIIGTVKEIISALEEQSHNKMIPIENIIQAATEKNIPKEKIEETLEKLRRSGDVFEPKRGFIQKL